MPVATDMVTPLWRGVVVVRIVTAVFTIGAIVVHHDAYARPALAWAVLVGIAVWTLLTCLAYSYDRTRRIHVIGCGRVADLGGTRTLDAGAGRGTEGDVRLVRARRELWR